MDDKIDFDIINPEPISDNDLPCEDRLEDIVMFCKSPYNYCIHKSIPISSFEKPLITEEELSLAKSVFEDIKVIELETLDPITGLSPIHCAAYFGNSSALIVASELGANLNVGTKKGMRAIHYAVVNKQVETLKILIERGAEVAIANNQGDTALHLACIQDNIEILKCLLDKGKMKYEMFQAVNSQGNTAMSVAVLNGQSKAVEFFVNISTEEIAGAGFVDIKGNTLLHLAAKRGDKEMVKTLIKMCPKSIKLNTKNKEGKKAFDLAHERFFSDCCEIIEAGVLEKDLVKNEYETDLSDDDKYFTENIQLQDKSLNPFKELWVHIDLKGAPPRQEFYAKLFELLKENEVTGVLLEVEDMIEFTGIYSCIRRENYYTDEQLQWIIQQAESYHMQVIPLIQCFGHLEFILKHKEFSMLREAPDSYFNLCPSNPASAKIMAGYIGQVLSKFPHAKYLHIGADEIFLMGACADCKLFLMENSRNSLFFNHVNKIIRKVKEIRDVEILIWDDMIR